MRKSGRAAPRIGRAGPRISSCPTHTIDPRDCRRSRASLPLCSARLCERPSPAGTRARCPDRSLHTSAELVAPQRACAWGRFEAISRSMTDFGTTSAFAVRPSITGSVDCVGPSVPQPIRSWLLGFTACRPSHRRSIRRCGVIEGLPAGSFLRQSKRAKPDDLLRLDRQSGVERGGRNRPASN